ncbi:MAG: hypothetical protein EZS28_043489 [Streblomastix strix]|uniref:Uncharacterized protein n=1 Tax=Streblomastix strix TaxID=222440 RepID=A0A5J4TRP7_9EUKA|nr:MAG: hypothetical protein EZS28_043489 [Streblomastix strix]
MKKDFARHNSAKNTTLIRLRFRQRQFSENTNMYEVRFRQTQFSNKIGTRRFRLKQRNIPLVFHPLSLFEMHITYP